MVVCGVSPLKTPADSFPNLTPLMALSGAFHPPLRAVELFVYGLNNSSQIPLIFPPLSDATLLFDQGVSPR